MDRREYMRLYQRKRRAANPISAREDQSHTYEIRKAREVVDPSLRQRRIDLDAEWKASHLEQLAAGQRRRYDLIRSTQAGLDAVRLTGIAYMRRYKQNPIHAIKLRARWRASTALRRGRLVRQGCEVCGHHRAEMHHDSYARPLDVRWLCKQHHEAQHKA